jgi:uncharacterized protein with von Willebrand factor type A (vWA) domain
MTSGQANTGFNLLAAVLSSDQVREAVIVPRIVPRHVREHLAEVVARELMPGEDFETGGPAPVAKMLGPLYPVYLATKQTEEWARLKEMSGRSMTIALFCVGATLTALLEAFEEMSGDGITDGTSEAQIAFGLLVREAMSLWGRVPGSSLPSSDRIAAFEQARDSAQVMSDLVHESCVPRIATFLDRMDGDAETMELVSLLFPGRLWDRGLAELHRENLFHIRQYADIASRSEELRQMIDMIGRQSVVEVPIGGAVATCSRSEMHSVVTSGDLQYILPSELVKLRDPTLKCLFMARWAEGKLLTYQLSGKARHDTGTERPRGSIVALVDTSGSMNGTPETIAKAVVLAAAKQALKSGRGMRVILFSSTGQSRAIDLSGQRTMAEEFLEFLRNGFGGGTDFDTALGSGIDALGDARYENADLLFVTDGLSKVTDDRLLWEWERLRQGRGTRIFTIVIGNDNAGGLEKISDYTFLLEAGNGPAGAMRLTTR